MAIPSIQLITALRETASRLRNGAHYAWGHHGACNCGNLLQVITPFTEGEILRYAHTGKGEWTEIAEEYCSTTNAPVNMVMAKLEQAGLTPVDIKNIEYLTDREVLKRLPGGFRWLKRNQRQDVIEYFEAFANLLEEQLSTYAINQYENHSDPDISTLLSHINGAGAECDDIQYPLLHKSRQPERLALQEG